MRILASLGGLALAAVGLFLAWAVIQDRINQGPQEGMGSRIALIAVGITCFVLARRIMRRSGDPARPRRMAGRS